MSNKFCQKKIWFCDFVKCKKIKILLFCQKKFDFGILWNVNFFWLCDFVKKNLILWFCQIKIWFCDFVKCKKNLILWNVKKKLFCDFVKKKLILWFCEM